MPWANGRGTTLEIIAFPTPEAWTWRLSLATVADDGPFSSLPGVVRFIAVAEGAGMVLTIDGVEHRLAKFEAMAFSGGAATLCALIDGPIRDLNLMVRRDGPAPDADELRVERIRRGTTVTAAGAVAMVVLDGAIAVSTPSPGFPGTPIRERAGRFDAFLLEGTDNERHIEADDEHAHTYARLGSVATAVVDSVVAFVSIP